MPSEHAPKGRWTWLTLSVLVSAVAIGALFFLHHREQDARHKELVARNYAARLEQSIVDLTPIGQYLLRRDPVALRQVVRRGLGLAGSRLEELRPIDPERTAEIARVISEVRTQLIDEKLQPGLAFARIARAEVLANQIADRERDRAQAAEKQALYGGAGALIFALLLVVALMRTERHMSLRAARHHASEIQHLADHDSLTGLPNRRRFDADLDGLADDGSYAGPIEIAVCDLNDFKQINDRLGHHAGDGVLVSAARDLEDQVGECGTVYRTGGDEFCVVSRPGQRVGEAVRRAFEREDAATLGSVGLATWPSDHLAPRSVVRLADKRMYEVKRAIERSGHVDRRHEPR